MQNAIELIDVLARANLIPMDVRDGFKVGYELGSNSHQDVAKIVLFVEYILKKEKLQAIKVLRELSNGNLGLKSAKDRVDHLFEMHDRTIIKPVAKPAVPAFPDHDDNDLDEDGRPRW